MNLNGEVLTTKLCASDIELEYKTDLNWIPA